MDPLNYTTNVANPVQSVLGGYQAGLQMQQAQQQQQLQQLQVAQGMQMQRDLAAFAQKPNPTGDDYAALMARYPQLADKFKASYDVLNSSQQQARIGQLTQVYAALHTGNPDIAADLLSRQADAAENSGDAQTAQGSRMMAQWVQTHPDSAMKTIGLNLAAADPSKFADTWKTLEEQSRADQKQPYEVRTAEANASKAETEAKYAGKTAQANLDNVSSQIAERAGRLSLDQDRLNSEYQMKWQELRRKPGAVDLPDSSLKIVNDSAQNSVLARNTAAQMDDLAGQIEKADPASFTGGTREWLKRNTGNENYITSLRQEYNRLKSGEATRNLPPGSASDKDIELAMSGFPKDTSDSKQLAAFLRGMSKLKSYESQMEDAKSQWVYSVGSLGRAGSDIQIGDTKVPKGTTFQDFAKRVLKSPGAAIQPQTPEAKAAQDLIDKYKSFRAD